MHRHATDSSEADTRPGRSIRGWQTIAVLLVPVLVVALVLASAPVGPVAGDGPTAGPVSAASDPNASSTTERTLVVSDVSTDPDSSATHRVALTDAPDGLAGFELTLVLESDDAATVAGASYPEHFGMTTDPVVSDDGRTITVEAVDLADEVTPGASDVTLARIDVTGLEAGETELRVTDLQVDADGGGPIEPTLEAGTLTVGEGETDDSGAGGDGAIAGSGDEEREADSESNSNGDSAETTDSVPGFTVPLTLLAAIAVLAAASRRL